MFGEAAFTESQALVEKDALALMEKCGSAAYETTAEGKKVPVWFAHDASRPLSSLAGIFVSGWKLVRKAKEGEVTADLYAFLTCEPNVEVGAIHPQGHARHSDDGSGT